MKRKLLIILSVSLFIIAVGWIAPWINGRVLVLACITLSTGFLLSILLSVSVFKFTGVKRAQFSKPTRRALNLVVALVGVGFALIVNTFPIKPIARWLYGIADWRVYSDQYTLNAILVGAFMALLVLGVFYVFLRLYEETLGRRMKRFARLSFRKGGWKLPLKLAIAGIAAFLFAEAVSSTGLVQAIEFAFEQQDGIRGLHRGANDSLGTVFIANKGISHQEYLRTAYLICSQLQSAKVRCVLIPLPKDLLVQKPTLDLVQKIDQLGFVVFAVPPNEGENEFPLLWVDPPLQGKLILDWGVLSAVKLDQFTQYSRKFYPLGYRESSHGTEVPDAAVRVIQKIRGKEIYHPAMVDGNIFRLGRFETGLYADHSMPIRYAIWGANGLAAVFSEEGSDSLKGFDKNMFSGRIVVIDPGEGITGFRSFGRTYAQILHEFLTGTKRMPLERWTPALLAMVVLIAVSLFTFYKPWQASLGLVILAFGQGFLCWQMNSRFGIVFEALPMFIAAMSSAMLFLFVRVNHERITLQKEEKQRALDELLAARDMQMGLMPKEDPIVPGFDISGICLPANDVGGDFFDYVWLDGKRRKLGIAVADVSGKAMKAAITAVMTSGMIYREAGGNESPKTILRNMNKPMYTKLDSRMFTALSFAVIDTRKKELRFSNAGQAYPLLKRGKEVRSLEVKGARLPLGVKEDVTYGEMAVKLKKGDTLIFYTDGIPEAKDEKDEFYGFERFKSLMENLGGLLAKEVRDRILSEVKSFTGNAPQHDDMTVVVVRVN